MKVHSKKTFKPGSIFFILFLVAIVILFVLQYDRMNLKNEIVLKQTLLSSLIRDSDVRCELEGEELYKILDLPKNSFLMVLNSTGKEFSLFIVVDSIDCYSCFKFHIDHIREIAVKGIQTLIYSRSHADLLSSSLKDYITHTFNFSSESEVILGPNIMVLLIDKRGKIIYVDAADKSNYEKSKKFYNKIKKFISNN